MNPHRTNNPNLIMHTFKIKFPTKPHQSVEIKVFFKLYWCPSSLNCNFFYWLIMNSKVKQQPFIINVLVDVPNYQQRILGFVVLALHGQDERGRGQLSMLVCCQI